MNIEDKFKDNKQVSEIISLFGSVPEVIGYSLFPTLIGGILCYEVTLSAQKCSISLSDAMDRKVDPEQFAQMLGLPLIVHDIPVIYFVDEAISASWWQRSAWAELESRSVVYDPGDYPIQAPTITSDEHILSMRKEQHVVYGGCEIGQITGLGIFGSLGGIVWDQSTDEPYWIGAAHVMCDNLWFSNVADIDNFGLFCPVEEVGTPIHQNRPSRKIGELKACGTYNDGSFNNVDAAIATIDSGIYYNDQKFGVLGVIPNASAATPSVGSYVRGAGRTSSLLSAEIGNTAYVVTQDGGPSILTYKTVAGSGYLKPGDSGTRVFLRDNNNPVGLFVGYHVVSSFMTIMPALSIEEDLGVTFTAPEGWSPNLPPVEIVDNKKPFIFIFH